MPARYIPMPVEHTAMRSGVFFMLMLVASTAATSQVLNQEGSYVFRGEVVDSKRGQLWFTYTNQSRVAQCIRAEDLAFKLYDDSIRVTTDSGTEARFIGRLGPGYGAQTPKEFIIVPPGERAFGAIVLKTYYALGRQDLTVSYAMPVIPCEALMKGYVKIPETSYLKKQLRLAESEILSEESKQRFPEWSRAGFIAVSEPLRIKRN